MALPQKVIDKDQTLDTRLGLVSDELMELRWHWTLDKSNPGRVSISDYARAVQRSNQIISADAKGWAEYVAECENNADGDNGSAPLPMPGKPSKPTEFRELAKMSGQRAEAAKAVARNTGLSVNTVTRTKRDEVEAVLSSARERAEKRGTTVEHEIETAAERREAARQAAAKLKDERKKRMTAAYISIEGDIGAMLQRGRKILKTAEDIEFGADETELLADALAKLRALLNLLDMRFTGQADINWDAELAKITE